MNKFISQFIFLLVLTSFVNGQDTTALIEEEIVDSGAAEIATSEPASTEENVADVDLIEEDDDLLLIEEEDELLISDDEEENILAPVVKEADPEETIEEIVVEDSSKESGQEIAAEDIGTSDKPDTSKEVEEKVSEEKVEVVEEITPIMVDSVKKINFAGNLKNYRSPRKAMFRSLLLPGWGQAYAKKEWKTAIFAGVEVGAIVGIAVMNYLGKEKGREAVNFAEDNYDKSNFVDFYEKYKSYVYTVFETTYKDFSATQIDSIREAAIIQDMYFGNDVDYYKSSASDKDLEEMWEGNYYVAGWNDFSTSAADSATTGYYFDNNGYHIDNTKFSYYTQDTTWFINNLETGESGLLGYSKLKKQYKDLRNEERDYYDRGLLFVGLLIANHVTSAIDAFISAKAYNDDMLEKESVWEHIGLENQLAYTFNGGVKTTLGIKIKF